MGRFLTPDPFGGSVRLYDPGSWNRYAYVDNDPVNNNDPSGLDPAQDGTIVVDVVGRMPPPQPTPPITFYIFGRATGGAWDWLRNIILGGHPNLAQASPGLPPSKTPFQKAQGKLQDAIGLIAATDQVSVECNRLFERFGAGFSFERVRTFITVGNFRIADGTQSQIPVPRTGRFGRVKRPPAKPEA